MIIPVGHVSRKKKWIEQTKERKIGWEDKISLYNEPGLGQKETKPQRYGLPFPHIVVLFGLAALWGFSLMILLAQLFNLRKENIIPLKT